ncbi:YpfN family protein [Escherichia coli]|nr:YpfN family protein [Escherichia coli]
MDWLAKYWWILVIVFLVGVLLNVIKDLKRVDHKKFLRQQAGASPVPCDFNDKWDDDDDWAEARPVEETVSLPLSRYRPPVTPLSGVTAFR